MPELPEVETTCRVMRRALQGKRVASVVVARDPVVFDGHSPEAVEKALVGRVVKSVGRRGKFFWLTLRGAGPVVFGHLGMSGWIRAIYAEGRRLEEPGDAPFDDPDGGPRFQRLLLRVGDGTGIVFTDARRFGRIWLGASPAVDSRIVRLGRDAYDDLPSVDDLLATFARRRIAIKAVLLDQSALAGIGNWIADEVLYQSRIAPKRAAASLARSEVASLRRAIEKVLERAVSVGADSHRFPKSWLFEHRWGGPSGAAIGRHPIVREEVGGRTTAWVPARQR